MSNKLAGIAKIAKQDKSVRFTSLMHLLSKENLAICFKMLEKNAASGIDDVTIKEYAQSLRTLLEESSIMEKKVFLRSFVERIEVDDADMKVLYTWPVPPETPQAETVGVLPFGHDGPPFVSPFNLRLYFFILMHHNKKFI